MAEKKAKQAKPESPEKQDLELGEAGKGGRKKKLLLIIGAAVLVLAIAGGAAFFVLKKKPPEVVEGETAEAVDAEAHTAEAEGEASAESTPSLRYVPLADAILANLPSETKARTIKVQVVFAVKTEEAEAAVKKHLPLLGSELLMLLSTTNAEQLMTPEGQQAFREQALQNANAAMAREEKKPLIERILFTQFVMQ